MSDSQPRHLHAATYFTVAILFAAASTTSPLQASTTAARRFDRPPIRCHPDHPRYFLFRGRPTVLIASGEHYGAVINRDFDYVKYLDTLAQYGMNYTRIYPGAYFETEHYFTAHNPLGPRPGTHLLPWARAKNVHDEIGIGGPPFDLDRIDPAYVRRLTDFVLHAGARDIVVQVCFFNCMYPDLWPLMPLYHVNNIQGVGTCTFDRVQTLDDARLVAYQERYVRAIVRVLRDFDNVIFEICDEPGLYGTPVEDFRPWIERMLTAIVDEEKDLPQRHLVTQMVTGVIGGSGDFSTDDRIGMVTGQYVWYCGGGQIGGMQLLDGAWQRGKPIELNETSYFPIWYESGDRVRSARAEAWEFIVGGGAAFNQLNAYFSTVDPRGATTENRRMMESMRALARFINGTDFLRLQPYWFARGIPTGTFARVTANPGREYCAYLHHSTLINQERYRASVGEYLDTIYLSVPAGTYRVSWIDPGTGTTLRQDMVTHTGGTWPLVTPRHTFDVALHLRRVDK